MNRINEVCRLILDITGRRNEAGKRISREAEIQVWKRSFTCLGIQNKHITEVRNLGTKPRRLMQGKKAQPRRDCLKLKEVPRKTDSPCKI